MSITKKSDLQKRIDLIAAEDRMNSFLSEIAGDARMPSKSLAERTAKRISSAILDFDTAGRASEENTRSGVFAITAVSKLSDFFAELSRLSFIDMRVGHAVGGLADDGGRRATFDKTNRSLYCTWRQDSMRLTLNCLPKKPYTVTLHLDEGPVVELSTISWIDEDTLKSDPNTPASIESFSLQQVDEKTYVVPDMDVVAFAARMGSINAAHDRNANEGGDVRLLLPFVA